MDKPLTNDALARGFAEEIAALLAARLGRPAPLQGIEVPAGLGWAVVVPFSGLANGRLTAWLDASLAAAIAGHGPQDGAAADREAGPVSALREFLAEVVAHMSTKPMWAGLSAGDVSVAEGPAPSGGGYRLDMQDAAPCVLLTACQLDAEEVRPLSEDRRLEAVLDVDLPLVVRFGRALMPLRALADLGPGAVIDMGRAPEDPVELLVGERIVARGEVVIVGGNYGVRITELTGGRLGADLDSRN